MCACVGVAEGLCIWSAWIVSFSSIRLMYTYYRNKNAMSHTFSLIRYLWSVISRNDFCRLGIRCTSICSFSFFCVTFSFLSFSFRSTYVFPLVFVPFVSSIRWYFSSDRNVCGARLPTTILYPLLSRSPPPPSKPSSSSSRCSIWVYGCV